MQLCCMRQSCMQLQMYGLCNKVESISNMLHEPIITHTFEVAYNFVSHNRVALCIISEPLRGWRKR